MSTFLNLQNHAGEKLDFHSLRHTCGAWLALRDVQSKVIQAVMRHSTITLTMDTYGHILDGSQAEALSGFGDLTNQRLCYTVATKVTGNYSIGPKGSAETDESREHSIRQGESHESPGIWGA